MLYPHQTAIKEFIEAHPRCLVISPMGAGKTRAVLSAITANALVVAPLRVARMVWPDEAGAMSIDCRYYGSRDAATGSASNFYATNFENTQLLRGIIPDGIDTLIIDESSKLKGFMFRQGTKRAKALYAIASRCKRVVLLTGTPCSESLGDLYSQVSFIDGGRTFGRAKSRFMQRYHDNVSHSPKYPVWQPKPGAYDAVLAAVKDFAQYFEPTITTYGHVDNTIRIEPTPAQRSAIAALRKDKVIRTADTTVYACNAAVLATRLLHLASGFSYTVTKDVVRHSTCKMDAVRDILDDNAGERFVIVANWTATMDALTDSLQDATRDITAFKEGRFKHLLINPASAAHGLSLQQQSHHMILVEPFYSGEQYAQVLERIGERRQAQSGLNRVVYYHYIECGPIDAAAWRALREKTDVEEAVINILKGV